MFIWEFKCRISPQKWGKCVKILCKMLQWTETILQLLKEEMWDLGFLHLESELYIVNNTTHLNILWQGIV